MLVLIIVLVLLAVLVCGLEILYWLFMLVFNTLALLAGLAHLALMSVEDWRWARIIARRKATGEAGPWTR